MSDTVQLFIVAAGWTIISVLIARLVPKWPGRTALFAVLVGVPFWELPYGYYNFQRHCYLEGGLHVVESILPQTSICADYPFDYSAQTLLRFGFESIEARNKTGEVMKLTTANVNTEVKTNKLTSNYCVTYVNNIHLPWRVIRHDFLITRASDKAVVARHSVLDWFGMWWQEAASPILGRGGICREDPIQPVMTALRGGVRAGN